MTRTIENSIYQEEEFENDALIPTVIFIEMRPSSQCIAGVWQVDHYELENGNTVLSPWEEIQKWQGSYNDWWRIWKYEPTDEERKGIPWKGKMA